MVDAMHDVVVASVRLGREGLIGNNLGAGGLLLHGGS